MKIGIGLPTTISGTPGSLVLDWARAAETAGFSTLGTIDRVVYPGYESMTALAAAGAVTETIGLLTDIVLAPTRNPVLLAKEAASIDQLTGGRLTLGVGVGGRPDDYVAAEQEFGQRGKRLDAMLETFHGLWEGETVAGSDKACTPTPTNGRVPVLIGGDASVAVHRMVRWGAGWTIGGLPPAMVAEGVDHVRQAWADSVHEGEPTIVALGYFALGDDASVDPLLDYYGFLGDMAQMIAGGATRSAEQARDVVGQWEALGIDEYVFFPAHADLEQVHRLAEAVLG
ncbi:MAG: LLM class flavin-dependent oxidoreductase [Acidimicrobiales bacterium]